MLVRCIDNKGFEARLELDRVYNATPFGGLNTLGYFVLMPHENNVSVYWDATRFEVCR